MKKYEIQGIIGIGSYGVVLKAVNRSSREIVAIKKFKLPDVNPCIKKIALREVKSLKSVQHPNIVRFIEAFSRENKLHIVFEFVDKTVLEDIESSSSGLPLSTIRSYIFQLLQALNALHSKKIIHRDIKPENLLVSSSGKLKLCDFGFARKLDEHRWVISQSNRLRINEVVPIPRGSFGSWV